MWLNLFSKITSFFLNYEINFKKIIRIMKIVVRVVRVNYSSLKGG